MILVGGSPFDVELTSGVNVSPGEHFFILTFHISPFGFIYIILDP